VLIGPGDGAAFLAQRDPPRRVADRVAGPGALDRAGPARNVLRAGLPPLARPPILADIAHGVFPGTAPDR
jgi:hypothetical protein